MIRRILTIRSRRNAQRAVDEEVRFHIDMRLEALLRSGECRSPEEARARAIREFGDVAEARRELTSMDERSAGRVARADWWRDVRQDARYALRDFRRHPAFTAIVVTMLALGIGANAAIFTLIDAVQFRQLPVPHAEELVALSGNDETGAIGSPSKVLGTISTYAVYQEIRRRNPFFTGILAAGVTGRLDVLPNASSTELEHPHGRFVSGNYFEVLDIGAGIGRVFDGSEDQRTADSPAVVLSHGYWLRRFAGDTAVVGRQMTIDRVSFTIIGVAPRGFFGEVVGESPDVWIPIAWQPAMMPNEDRLRDGTLYWLQLIGRLKPGVSLADAEAGSRTLMRQVLAEQVRQDPAHLRMPDRLEVVAQSGATGYSALREDFSRPLLTLMVGVALVLLIVCANVGNLLLARAVARRREMAVRIAIGAGRARLVRQLLTESAVLAVASGALGLIFASWGSRLLVSLTSVGRAELSLGVGLNLPVLLFTAAISFGAVMLFGLAPAYRATRVDIAPVLRAQGRGGLARGPNEYGRRIPLTKALVVGQVTLSLVLLVGAALLVRSLRTLERTDPGFDRDHLLIVNVDDAARGYSGARHLALVRELSARFAALPGVTAVAFSQNGLFSGSDWSTEIQVPGFTARTAKDSSVRYDAIGPGYARTLGARLISGRDITDRDVEGSSPIVVVNDAMARYYFGDADPLGRTISFADSATMPVRAEIVGVVANLRTGETSRRDGAKSLTQAPVRRFYFPYLQHAGSAPPTELRFMIRVDGDPAALIVPARRTIAALDPTVPVDDIYPIRWRIRESIAREQLLATLSSGFGTLALLLAGIGLYGLMMHTVSRRTGELGLRMALGADRSDIVAMVLGEALRLVGGGLVLGVPAGYVMTRLISPQVHGIAALDVPSIAVAFGVLLAAAIAASLVPAVRASRVAPIVALQQE